MALNHPLKQARRGLTALLWTAGMALSGAQAFADEHAEREVGGEAGALLPCPFGYAAEICASEVNPGFEFIPVDGPLLFTGEDASALIETHTFRVEVEIGAGPTVRSVLAQVQDVLGDHRGWTGEGTLGFRHLGSAAPALSILIATPAQVDVLCAPLDTEGYFSCRNGGRAVLNVDRWINGVPHWTAGIEAYRAYLINHEVGHFLGKGHVRCPVPGQPAPVMQQQSVDLMGCAPNGWPYR